MIIEIFEKLFKPINDEESFARKKERMEYIAKRRENLSDTHKKALDAAVQFFTEKNRPIGELYFSKESGEGAVAVRAQGFPWFWIEEDGTYNASGTVHRELDTLFKSLKFSMAEFPNIDEALFSPHSPEEVDKRQQGLVDDAKNAASAYLDAIKPDGETIYMSEVSDLMNDVEDKVLNLMWARPHPDRAAEYHELLGVRDRYKKVKGLAEWVLHSY